MSVEPQALERSVLERKERDELAAIAEAMGVKAGARTSKANLIGQILREAGIETGDDKPKRPTRAKSENGAADAATAEPADEAGDPASSDAASSEAPSEQPAAASAATETSTEKKSEARAETQSEAPTD